MTLSLPQSAHSEPSDAKDAEKESVSELSSVHNAMECADAKTISYLNMRADAETASSESSQNYKKKFLMLLCHNK